MCMASMENTFISKGGNGPPAILSATSGIMAARFSHFPGKQPKAASELSGTNFHIDSVLLMCSRSALIAAIFRPCVSPVDNASSSSKKKIPLFCEFCNDGQFESWIHAALSS